MSFAEDLNDAMAPWQTPDLTDYNNAIATMFSEVEQLAFETDDGEPGWSVLFDVDLCPEKWLPWLGQFVGVRIPVGTPEAEARSLIRTPPNWQVGQPQAVVNTVKRFLTGAKTVTLTERHSVANPADPAYGLTVTITAAQSGLSAGTYTSTSRDAKGIWQAIVSVSNPNTIRLVVT